MGKDELLRENSMDQLRARETGACVGDANSIQHGGSHYRESAGIQHWDFVHMQNLNYYQGNATKYVTRYKNKNGVEDLRKAIHYCHKAQDLGLGMQDVIREGYQQDLFQFAADNRLDHDQYEVCRLVILGMYGEAMAHLHMMVEQAQRLSNGPATGTMADSYADRRR